jgi:hypothetical protein
MPRRLWYFHRHPPDPRMTPAKLLVLPLALFLGLLTTSADAETRLVGPGGQPASLRAAIEAAQDGDVIELLSGEYRGESIVIPPKRLTIRGVGERPVFKAEGKVADGKAIFVMKGGELTVQNVEFRGARAPDANGAGIRLEAGRLRVVDCAFFDNENGILTSNDEQAELTVESSVFADAPRVVGGLYHLLYVGRIGKFSISGSRFHSGFEGHLLKSRARENRITGNLFHDGPRGGASYEIDLPNGGQAWIVGNVISQAADSQNPVVVAYGAEGRPWERNALYLSHNTLINDKSMPAWFLRVFRDRLPESTEVHAVNNLTVGLGVFDWGARGDFRGNQHVWSASALADPAMLAFEPAPGSGLRGTGIDPRGIAGQDLAPKVEFRLPVGIRTLPPATRWTPGAFQR